MAGRSNKIEIDKGSQGTPDNADDILAGILGDDPFGEAAAPPPGPAGAPPDRSLEDSLDDMLADAMPPPLPATAAPTSADAMMDSLDDMLADAMPAPLPAAAAPTSADAMMDSLDDMLADTMPSPRPESTPDAADETLQEPPPPAKKPSARSKKLSGAAAEAVAAALPEPEIEPFEDPLPAIFVDDAADDPFNFDTEEEVPKVRAILAWVLPISALLAIGIWFGMTIGLALPELQKPMTPVAGVQFISALCVPPVLLGMVWLLLQRTSTAEARRYAKMARHMRAESAALQRSVAVVARQVDKNRVALGQQISALMSLGDTAAMRLGAIGTRMAHEVAQAEEQSQALAEAANAAHANLSVLLATLPRAHTETHQLAAMLEATGLCASERAGALDAQIAGLTERSRAADELASGAAQRLAAHIIRMDATSETAGARLEGVTANMSNAVDELLGRTATAVDEARKGIAAQGDAMLAMLEVNQASLTRASRDSAEGLAERIDAIETVINRIAARLDDQRAVGDALVLKLESDFSVIENQLATFHQNGIERTQTLAASISALGGSANAMAEALQTGEDMARKVINTSEDLLTSLDAAAREIDETLPEALGRLDARISASRAVVSKAKPELLALVTAAESTHDAIEAIAQVIQGQRATLDQLSAALLSVLSAGREKADAIGSMLDQTITRTNDFAEETAPRLVESLIRVRETANNAADRARETLATVIPEAARALELASAQAMQRATGDALERHIASIAHAAENAVDVAARASEQLSHQLAAIGETSAAVEQRIDDARAEREQAESDGFSRRASLLIEALNSASIDIAKSFSNEVSDSAWAAYLKGDRGVFTRRAVRLLDTGDARDIARLYDSDTSFREHVNRYIHDFEAMLRIILAQRDGSPMGVTLLSSDMGKLYVALAQAIERLRA